MDINLDISSWSLFNDNSFKRKFRFGVFIRRLKIDELPQLINVLIGDMSIVGPRPWIQKTCNMIPDWAHIRNKVRPGMTGLAQVNGNDLLSLRDKCFYDREYVRNQSLLYDMKIIYKTIAVVLNGERLV